MQQNELKHYGVVGMKWGHRKAQKYSGYAGSNMSIHEAQQNRNSAKKTYKQSRREYNKSFNKAYNNSALHPITQFATKKGKAKSNALWTDAANKAETASKAKEAYKTSKKDVKAAKARNNMKTYEDSYGKGTVDRVTSAKTGKLAAQTVLMGSYGALKYNESRAMKNSGRGKALVEGLISGSLSYDSAARVQERETRERIYR